MSICCRCIHNLKELFYKSGLMGSTWSKRWFVPLKDRTLAMVLPGVAVGGREVDSHGEVHRRPALDVVDEGQPLLDLEASYFDDAGVFVAALPNRAADQAVRPAHRPPAVG